MGSKAFKTRHGSQVMAIPLSRSITQYWMLWVAPFGRISPTDTNIIGIACDHDLAPQQIQQFDLNQPQQIVDGNSNMKYPSDFISQVIVNYQVKTGQKNFVTQSAAKKKLFLAKMQSEQASFTGS